jgi:hypothetical protein
MYRRKGWGAIARMFTIKESSVREWAKRFHGEDEEAIANCVTRARVLGGTVADFVESFVPKPFRRP